MADIEDGQTVEVQGSGSKPYILKKVGGVYSCSCPAWRNQSIGLNLRTCKHLKKIRGEAAEAERIGLGVGPTEKPAENDSETADSPTKNGPPILLAESWDNFMDLTDWWMSEKLDGVRAYWDGKAFLSRQGNIFHAPDWFTEGFPEFPLDGELWLGRREFSKTVSIVRRQDKSDHWRNLRFMVFDAPEVEGGFETRLGFLQDSFSSKKLAFATILENQRCQGLDHLKEEMDRIQSLQGEGLMLRQPASKYEVGRSSTLLKVKRFHDAEAVVISHQAGKGKHKGKLGALTVQLPNGVEFSVGTGFSDKERASPPRIGAKITFRYQELSDAGVPRFPSFVRVCPD